METTSSTLLTMDHPTDGEWHFRDSTTGYFYRRGDEGTEVHHWWNPNADPRLSSEVRSRIDSSWIQTGETPRIFLSNSETMSPPAHEQPHIVNRVFYSAYFRCQEQEETRIQKYYSYYDAAAAAAATEVRIHNYKQKERRRDQFGEYISENDVYTSVGMQEEENDDTACRIVNFNRFKAEA